jgi:Zn-dependent protease with chaperone function
MAVHNESPFLSTPPLVMQGVVGNLALASFITLGLLGGMVLALALGLLFMVGNPAPANSLTIAVSITVVFNAGAFFLSPFIMDLVQQRLYQTHWVGASELEQYSPGALRIIQKVCMERNLKEPRLGIIEDNNPTAFTYGSLPNSARVVVSRGLFKYLDDAEVAAVYAHELGHIVHWDFAVMTFASNLVQICYLIFVYVNSSQRGRDKDDKSVNRKLAIVAYIFYIVGSWILLYLSRVREYYADNFSAQVTGDPNALARSLVKIANGIVQEKQQEAKPSRLLEGTRALGIYDHKAAASTGITYQVASTTESIGRVFLWDMFNPWGWWMELSSTHPLTGKRIRALNTYAEELGLRSEFDMGPIIDEGNHLNRRHLYGHFILDLLLFNAPWIGCFGGFLLGWLHWTNLNAWAAASFGSALGLLIYTIAAYPKSSTAEATTVLELLSDPYASPLRGRLAILNGELIGRGDAGYHFGSNLKLQDPSGLMYLRYASLLGPLGNFLFGAGQAKRLLGANVTSVGWFRRGIAPWMDLVQIKTASGHRVNSFPRLESIVGAVLMVAIGSVLLVL